MRPVTVPNPSGGTGQGQTANPCGRSGTGCRTRERLRQIGNARERLPIVRRDCPAARLSEPQTVRRERLPQIGNAARRRTLAADRPADRTQAGTRARHERRTVAACHLSGTARQTVRKPSEPVTVPNPSGANGCRRSGTVADCPAADRHRRRTGTPQGAAADRERLRRDRGRPCGGETVRRERLQRLRLSPSGGEIGRGAIFGAAKFAVAIGAASVV